MKGMEHCMLLISLSAGAAGYWRAVRACGNSRIPDSCTRGKEGAGQRQVRDWEGTGTAAVLQREQPEMEPAAHHSEALCWQGPVTEPTEQMHGRLLISMGKMGAPN